MGWSRLLKHFMILQKNKISRIILIRKYSGVYFLGSSWERWLFHMDLCSMYVYSYVHLQYERGCWTLPCWYDCWSFSIVWLLMCLSLNKYLLDDMEHSVLDALSSLAYHLFDAYFIYGTKNQWSCFFLQCSQLAPFHLM